MVTVFLIVTALLNIGVGYWLAVYLRRARGLAELAPADEHALDSLHDLDLPVAESITAASPVATPPATPAAIATAPTTTAPAPAEEQLEQDVLAGIEEFRNQLAQMKSRGEGEAPTPAAAPAEAAPAGAPA